MFRHGLGLAFALATCSCSTVCSREPWVFALSRECYEKPRTWGPQLDKQRPTSGSEALLVFGVLLLPFTLDVALLPITVPRDLAYAR